MELKQGDLENIILNALWLMEEEGNTQIDVRDVQERIKTKNQSWAYTTVKTVLDRLVDKTLISRKKEGKKYLYKTEVPRVQAGEEAIKKIVKQYFRDSYGDMIACAGRIGTINSEQRELLTISS